MLESSKGTSLCCRCKRGRSIGVAKYARRKNKNECVLPLSQAPSVYPCWTTLPLPPLPRFTFGTQQRATKSYKARNTENSMRCRSHSHITSFVHLVVGIFLATARYSLDFRAVALLEFKRTAWLRFVTIAWWAPRKCLRTVDDWWVPASKHITSNLLECGKENCFL